MDWMVTLPQKTEWSEYEKELKAVEDWSSEMMYRLPNRPKAKKGDRCFLIWRGRVRGWMEVVNVIDMVDSGGFRCSTTGKRWPPGYYICRSGPFHKVDGPEIHGFQGIRRMVFDVNKEVCHPRASGS